MICGLLYCFLVVDGFLLFGWCLLTLLKGFLGNLRCCCVCAIAFDLRTLLNCFFDVCYCLFGLGLFWVLWFCVYWFWVSFVDCFPFCVCWIFSDWLLIFVAELIWLVELCCLFYMLFWFIPVGCTWFRFIPTVGYLYLWYVWNESYLRFACVWLKWCLSYFVVTGVCMLVCLID